ncbi:oligosaccharide repeat unit polymerase [Thiopseudomonas alkaliphila]|uniref:oligosaccharide repeat unit polymerase n=1 Tax=Thiopseudomonas alkaliphila TaxID=1697053 RepID=UPI003571755B
MESSYRKEISLSISLSYLYWISVLMIFLSSVFYYFEEYYGGDLAGVDYPVDKFKLIVFTSIYLFFLTGSLWLSKVLLRLKLSDYIVVVRSKLILYLFFILFYLIVFFLIVFFGVGTIHRDVETNRFAELFFAFFDPYTFMIVIIYYIFYSMSDRFLEKLLFLFCFFVYFFLIVRSGFTGFLIPLIPIFISFLLKFLSKALVIFLLGVSVISFPFIRIGKWIIGAGMGFFSEYNFNLDLIHIATRGVIERFSAVPNMVYVSEALVNKNEFLQSDYLPFFQGYLGSFLHKLFFINPVALNTLLLHQTIHNTDQDSNSTFPIVSYFSLEFFLGITTFVYVFFLVFIISRLLLVIFGRAKLGNKLSLYLLFFIMFFYAFNGWFWAVWGVIQALIVFVFILFLFGKLSRVP